MGKRVLSHDPLTGVTEYFEATPEGFNIHTVQDVDPIIEMNKAKQREGRGYYAKDKDMWRVASIPNTVLLDWAVKDGVPPGMVFSAEYADRIARRLNSSEFRDLKTADVRI